MGCGELVRDEVFQTCEGCVNCLIVMRVFEFYYPYMGEEMHCNGTWRVQPIRGKNDAQSP